MQFDYQNKNIVVIGLGLTGRSCIDYFLSKKVTPKAIDTRLQIEDQEQLSSLIPLHLGSFQVDWILNADLIVISPGLSIQTPIIQAARAKGIEVIGDIELFCREINQTNSKIIAITGSNGKTTVTTLIYRMLQEVGFKVVAGGNIGAPVLTLLTECYDYFVLELSSFQLETTFSLKSEIATILNFCEDHLDRYPEGFLQYVQAKQRIYHAAKIALYNEDDLDTKPSFKVNKTITFGLHQGDYCLDKTDSYLQAYHKDVLPINQLSLKGTHNALNALVALAVGDLLKLERLQILKTLRTFIGLSHRYEPIGFYHGIEFINDSKATNVGSTIAALKSAEYKGNLHLLLGGEGKNADFLPLQDALITHQKDHPKNLIYLYCYGKDKLDLAQLLPAQTFVATTLQEALVKVKQQAKSGDLVLLSPACASLDQFKNYQDRGDQFSKIVKVLFNEKSF